MRAYWSAVWLGLSRQAFYSTQKHAHVLAWAEFNMNKAGGYSSPFPN